MRKCILGCLCVAGMSALCAASQRHLRLLGNFIARDELAHLPSFPTSDGLLVTKDAVVRAFEHLPDKSGCALTDHLARRVIGGHSARVNGAKYFAGTGTELSYGCMSGTLRQCAVERSEMMEYAPGGAQSVVPRARKPPRMQTDRFEGSCTSAVEFRSTASKENRDSRSAEIDLGGSGAVTSGIVEHSDQMQIQKENKKKKGEMLWAKKGLI